PPATSRAPRRRSTGASRDSRTPKPARPAIRCRKTRRRPSYGPTNTTRRSLRSSAGGIHGGAQRAREDAGGRRGEGRQGAAQTERGRVEREQSVLEGAGAVGRADEGRARAA